MKIDLHCHTIKTKSGEPESRNVTPELFAKKIRAAGVRIVGITNHNIFDKDQYTALQMEVKDECQVWPGVELNIEGVNGKQWHLIVISDPSSIDAFSDILSELTKGTTPETCVLKLENVTTAFAGIECLYIPHYHKSPEISEEDSLKLQELVGDEARILNETADVRSMGVFANHHHRVIIGSDVRDWSVYEKSTFSELRLPVESFHQLYMLARRDAPVVQTLLERNDPISLRVTFLDNIKLDVELYNEVNVIFGSKGTGKSEILNAIHEKLEETGLSCAVYTGSDKDAQFTQQLSTDDMIKDLAEVGAESCVDEFEQIAEWEDINPTPIYDYTQWAKTKDRSSNKQRMKITQAHTPPSVEPAAYRAVKEDLENVRSGQESLNEIDITKYLDEGEAEQLDNLVSKLEQNIYTGYKREFIGMLASAQSRNAILRFKSLADKMSDTKSKPSTTGFADFALNRIQLYTKTSKILDNITNKEGRSKELMGTLEGKGGIFVERIFRMCTILSKREEFGGRSIQGLRGVVTALKDVKNGYQEEGVYRKVSNLCEKIETASVTSTLDFLGISKRIVREDGTPYKPSNGEKSILMMQKTLSQEKNAYIFDEPELGMGNSYIDASIRPLISDLGKNKKIVVIATHNANIAVRTLPYKSIYRMHDNGVYKTYIGNPFVNMLTNMDDETDVLSWKETSMKVLEGGEEAFYERKDIYEARAN